MKRFMNHQATNSNSPKGYTMKHFNLRYKLLVTTLIALFVWAVAADMPFTFKAGDLISADQMNENFAALNTGKQELVKGTCAAGSSIRIIAPDGSVTCEVDDIGNGSNSGVDAINSMTGAVTLQAGDNITIDDSQQGQIKISSSSSGSNSNTHDHFEQTWTGSTDKSGLAVLNTNASKGSSAVFGRSDTGSGIGLDTFAAGVWGDSKSGYGVYGTSSGYGVYGKSPFIAVYGEGEFTGVIGASTRADGIGVSGSNSSSGIGVQGSSTDGTGVFGQTSGSNYGVRGYSPSGRGVFGESQSGYGVYGESRSNNAVYGVTVGTDTNATAIAGTSDFGYAAYFEAGKGVGQGYATCTFKAGEINWDCTSDRNLKENFESVNPVQILDAVAAMPITTWNVKGFKIRQLGPTAQDFYAAFSLGDTDKSINNTNAQGVALAAIQGLYQLVQEQQAKIEELEAKLLAMSNEQ
jgi:Chaperone of endosialidase